MSDRIELVWNGEDLCGEAPLWLPDEKQLVWLDITGGKLHTLTPIDNAVTTTDLKIPASGMVLNRTGELLLGGEEGLFLWKGPGDYRRVVIGHDETLAINDLIADRAGRVYAGTIHWGADGMERPGKLYLIEPSGSVRVVDEGILLANGLGFSPDDCTLYFADSAARTIYAYDVDRISGALSNKRVFTRIPEEDGIPDGLTVDAEGFVWCALWYGGQVARFDPDGRLDRRIALPVSQVSSVAFGGDDLDTLYITTAAESWPNPLEPPSFDWSARRTGGGLYRVRVDAQGRAAYKTNFPAAGERGGKTGGTK